MLDFVVLFACSFDTPVSCKMLKGESNRLMNRDIEAEELQESKMHHPRYKSTSTARIK